MFPGKGIFKFGKKGKLSPTYIVPLEILEKVSNTTYTLALPPQLSNVRDVFHMSSF